MCQMSSDLNKNYANHEASCCVLFSKILDMLNQCFVENQTVMTEFILLGLSDDLQVQFFLFFVFLAIYVVTLLANFMIILVIRAEHSLQTPMFFFLKILAFVDICYSSITVPKMLENFVSKEKSISVVGCYAQIFFYIPFSCEEIFLLTVMSYDRYVAICDPLHYPTIMNTEMSHRLVAGTFVMSFLAALINTVPLIGVTFCGCNRISHYTCDLPALLSLSCSENSHNHLLIFLSCFLFGIVPFFLTLVSYIRIISTILEIQSTKGRSKAFSTCSSHLIVTCLFYFSAFASYLKPRSRFQSYSERVASIQYLILSPLLNPIIYSLKNNEIKTNVKKKIVKCR
ncbi:olfactory receptor 10A7 [Anolis carolinensis]|uniref:G-protein coupled receptors family 1 profile domain-containing protein n=2 Tax=Anolis carolinensis TaxID=28377 RepID=A0A803TCQ8_ANOCA|nr:PREDICTED: olfactory receptor 10A7-like [Anolis carolinensis]|eukprot:XP_008114748.2 PREDICTED: olfactory receptor 10A7-like [Anolis carolinensis]